MAEPVAKFRELLGSTHFLVAFVGASINNRTPSLPQRRKCGVSSFSRAARARATRENDLAATIKTELAATV